MRSLALLLGLVACADLSPDKARPERLGIYECIVDEHAVQGCRIGATLVRPYRDGTPFVAQAFAPGAWILQADLHFPQDGIAGLNTYVGTRETSDSVYQVWYVPCPTCQWLYWSVQVMGPNGRVFARDSLYWSWP